MVRYRKIGHSKLGVEKDSKTDMKAGKMGIKWTKNLTPKLKIII
jgi:hypothetical protein